jgi:hypothetical protein
MRVRPTGAGRSVLEEKENSDIMKEKTKRDQKETGDEKERHERN